MGQVKENLILNKYASLGTILTVASALITIPSIAGYPKSFNVLILFIIVAVIDGLFLVFYWFASINKLKIIIKRICFIFITLLNIFLLGMELLFIDHYAFTVIIPVICIFAIFVGTVFFLIESIRKS